MATLKQKRAFDRVGENGGNISRAMIDVGYSPITAHHTEKLTKSKGWKELMDKFLPDSHLGKKHREFLDTPRQIRIYKKGDLETETEETDPSAVKALDMAYKLKGHYKQGEGGNINIVVFPTELIQKNGIQITPGAKPDSE